MTNIYNFSLVALLKTKTEIALLPNLNSTTLSEISNYLLNFFDHKIKITIGEQLAPNNQTKTNDKNLLSIFNEEAIHTHNSLEFIYEKNDPTLLARYDDQNKTYYLCHIPLFIYSKETLTNLPNFIPLSKELIKELDATTEEDIIALGYGFTDKVKDIFNLNYDNLFEFCNLINLLPEKNKHSFNLGVIHENTLIIPFYTITSFYAAYIEQEKNILEKYTQWLINFRNAIDICKLMNIKYKPIKGFSTWLTENNNEKSILEASSFIELSGLYEEDIPTNNPTNNSNNKNLPIQINTFSESTIGTLCTVVKWLDKGLTVINKIYYPLENENEKLIEKLSNNLAKTAETINSQTIELDENNEQLLTQTFQLNQTKLLN